MGARLTHQRCVVDEGLPVAALSEEDEDGTQQDAPSNYKPAAAGIRRVRAFTPIYRLLGSGYVSEC